LTPLTIRRVAIDTFREHVAYLHRDCTAVRAEGFQALSKVEVSGNGSSILAVLNVVDDECIVGPTELGLSEEAFSRLGLAAGLLGNGVDLCDEFWREQRRKCEEPACREDSTNDDSLDADFNDEDPGDDEA